MNSHVYQEIHSAANTFCCIQFFNFVICQPKPLAFRSFCFALSVALESFELDIFEINEAIDIAGCLKENLWDLLAHTLIHPSTSWMDVVERSKFGFTVWMKHINSSIYAVFLFLLRFSCSSKNCVSSLSATSTNLECIFVFSFIL